MRKEIGMDQIHQTQKCYSQFYTENSLNFDKTVQKSYFVYIFKSKHSKV